MKPTKEAERLPAAGMTDADTAEALDRIADRLIGMPAIAAALGLSKVTTLKLARERVNDLPVTLVGGRWWASRRALEAWMRRQLMSPDERLAALEKVGEDEMLPYAEMVIREHVSMLDLADPESAAAYLQSLGPKPAAICTARGVVLNFTPKPGTGGGRRTPEGG